MLVLLDSAESAKVLAVRCEVRRGGVVEILLARPLIVESKGQKNESSNGNNKLRYNSVSQ